MIKEILAERPFSWGVDAFYRLKDDLLKIYLAIFLDFNFQLDN